MPAKEITCIYCGQVKSSSKEHVLQRGLGGVDCLESVCECCNRKLRDIDATLTDKSPLSILARRELLKSGPMVWDVFEFRNYLLVEGLLTPGSDSVTARPQIIFDGEETLFFGDAEDIAYLGSEASERLFYLRLKQAYVHYLDHGPDARRKDHKDQDMLKLRQIKMLRPPYRLPPRICAMHQFLKFNGPVVFELRYADPADIDRAISALSALEWDKRSTTHRVVQGSHNPELHLSYSITGSIRALTKVAFNLVAFFCKSTAASVRTFPDVVHWIIEARNVHNFADRDANGFVSPTDLVDLSCPLRCHKFRLTHDHVNNIWKFYAALFGGKAAASLTFPGPNRESWATMDVVAPYNKKFQKPEFSEWHLPITTTVIREMKDVIPSIPWTKTESKFRIEPPGT